MKNLFQLITKYYFFLLFLLLFSFSLYLVVRYNNYQNAQMSNFARNFSGNFFNWVSGYKEYIALKETNRSLLNENAELRNSNRNSWIRTIPYSEEADDSVYNRKYRYYPATVVNNSVNKQYNYLTLDKGSKQGIKPEMGVLSSQGVVGIVKDVSENFSTVIPILNRNLKLSAKFSKNNYFGSLEWHGSNYKTARLQDIPHHVNIQPGDTIVTTGFSAVFPEGLLIGFVKDFKLEGGSFYTITVNLSTDFKNLFFVNVIENMLQEEQVELEKETPDD